MFETQGFRNALEQVIESQASSEGMRTYESQIVDYLRDLAFGNERDLMKAEESRPVGERRGIPEALTSARRLVIIGARFAAEDNRTLLKMGDVERAYRAQFCSVWPFCK